METTLIDLRRLWISLKQDNFMSGTHVAFLCPFKGINILIFIYLAIYSQGMVYLERAAPPMQPKTLRGANWEVPSPVFPGKKSQNKRPPSLNFLLFLLVWSSVPMVVGSILPTCTSYTPGPSVSPFNSIFKLYFKVFFTLYNLFCPRHHHCLCGLPQQSLLGLLSSILPLKIHFPYSSLRATLIMYIRSCHILA